MSPASWDGLPETIQENRMIPASKLERLKKSFYAKFLQAEANARWPWQAANENGRAKLSLGQKLGVSKWAARIAFFLHHGYLEKGLEVCHTCDNGMCVNPNHLFLGTHQDNMTDMKVKGRARSLKGVENKNAKLTREAVISISRSPLSVAALAAKFGVHKNTVYNIRSGRTHLTTLGAI